MQGASRPSAHTLNTSLLWQKGF